VVKAPAPQPGSIDSFCSNDRRRMREAGAIAGLVQARHEERDHLRRGDSGGGRIGRRLVTVHEAMLGFGIILDDSRGSAAEQCVSERAIGLGARDVVDARLADMHRAADGGGKLERVAALIGFHRVIDRWIGGGASLDAPVLRGTQQHETPAEAEAENSER
jgi:hypothetical protein